MFKKYIFTFCSTLLLSSVFLHAESIYGFGADDDMSSSQKSYANQPVTMGNLRQKINEQNERIDGLTTIIEGLSASVHELESQSIKKNAQPNSNDALLQKLAAMIDEINANYVRKDEQSSIKKKKSVQASVSDKSTSTKSNAQLYREGVQHFMKQRYAEAKKNFMLTDENNYKPAASNYYLGEISYYTKEYEDAIFYFRKSAGLYDKATYIDTLLLHTAISFHKTGDKEQARIFYNNIIENYPQKKTAKIARNRVKKL